MKGSSKKRIILKCLLIIFGLLMCGFIAPLKLTKYDFRYENLPDEFDGYRIFQISDFHCKSFGKDEEPLIKMVKKANPDIIVLTGDIVDEVHTTKNAEALLKGITDLAPVYYVTGNHEYVSGAPYDEFIELCNQYGVKVLHDETVEIKKGNSKILLTGVDYTYNSVAHMKDVVGYANQNYFNVLLYHDSSKFNYISEYGYDLVLCGHGHGGLVRLPYFGGVFGTDGHLFPKYDYGVFKEKNSTMVSSSGLGNARIPRWNNPRECVVIKLHKEK
ncbi:metallophosphoesterase [Pseudobutyrivibrio xylanivorans]|uniref:Metallophosphoesterase n=1 Tax=Pseudobutyrivibrio xylanivorans TaxID=185007 RepID=A0A5P6VTK1_PSEXY|nr:metallophosphoesterase [Pseudobutyrivibrio xylanivorans]QFJ56045.1 metallophosphoesterase [Pseudobutyrivibrio xylanivorans]